MSSCLCIFILIFLICIFMNINEYVKIYGKNGKTSHSGSHWGLLCLLSPYTLSHGNQHVCEDLLNKENECNYGLTYQNYEFLNGFHGNSASLYYEFDTCSQTFCKSPQVLGIKLLNWCQIKADTLAFLFRLFWLD